MRANIWLKNLLVMVGAGLLSAACQTSQDKVSPPIMNGNWASSDGVYTAEFRNGNFRAIANDTGGVISEGRYVALAENKVQLQWRGVVSGKENQAECLKPSPNQLDCVDNNGNKFSLRRG